MIRLLVRRALRLLGCAALVLAAAAPAQGAQVQLPVAVVLPVQILGADSFCTGGFVAGGTASAPTLTCITGGGPGPLTCSILGAPSGTVALNSSVSLTMSCSGGTSPYTYSWSPGSATTANLATTVAATTTFTATATDSAIPAATSTKSVTVTVGGGGGGGGGINCSAQGFANTTVINENWASPSTNVVAKMGVNDAIVVQFTTGSATSSNLTRVSAGEWQSTPSNRQGTLSTQSCDFGTGVGGYGSTSSGSSITMYFSVGKANNFGFPQLATNTTYFVNIQNTQPNAACAVNGICDMFISLYKGGL